ncbi:MAG: hypothetical protein FWG98_05340 [Candidatus Cloacimonetes bacterium]|nr:hypothetical protein [Candidatus Cloacimonadota bacterium]
MKVFKERTEYRRYKNRNPRFGILIKLVICIFIFSIVMGYTSINFDNILWLFK